MPLKGRYSDRMPVSKVSDAVAKDTSEISAKVYVESSRPANFTKCGRFLKDCGMVIPVETLEDMMYDLKKGLTGPVFVEYFNEKSLKEKKYGVLVDIGGQDIISHVRLVLKSSGSKRNKSLEAYNPHEKTIETLVYHGKKQNVPTTDPIKRHNPA